MASIRDVAGVFGDVLGFLDREGIKLLQVVDLRVIPVCGEGSCKFKPHNLVIEWSNYIWRII